MNADKLKQLISPWASTLSFRVRIYFYGSRFKEKHKPESDYDFAIEFLEPWVHHTLTWIDYHDSWQAQLSKIIESNVHLELYDNRNVNVQKYIQEGSMVIFESPETVEESFEKDLAALVKRAP